MDNRDNVLVISSETKNDTYTKFLITYFLSSNKYTLVSDTNTLVNYNLKDYNYVVTLDNDEHVRKFLKDIYKKNIWIYNIN